ncbi:sperm acrosome membrane-associated protein 4-like [Scleropages formosus]|uniref:Sperm acrosome membrane-associated protein 4-like n=1 Tax=Scleropages formosus TaxID=113540 RepID=A0A0N8JX70_SCLFO|nr:sperm acrosome membrane-associated protein 4-like [Scleropages formosus]
MMGERGNGGVFLSAQALQCYKCDLGFWNLCITSTMTCASGEQCFSGVGKAAQVIDIKTKGCLSVAQCNQVSNVTFGSSSVIYSMNKTCCNTDLCNAAPGQTRAALLSLTLATLTGVLVTGTLL